MNIPFESFIAYICSQIVSYVKTSWEVWRTLWRTFDRHSTLFGYSAGYCVGLSCIFSWEDILVVTARANQIARTFQDLLLHPSLRLPSCLQEPTEEKEGQTKLLPRRRWCRPRIRSPRGFRLCWAWPQRAKWKGDQHAVHYKLSDAKSQVCDKYIHKCLRSCMWKHFIVDFEMMVFKSDISVFKPAQK